MKGLLFITHQTDLYDYLKSVNIVLKGGCRHIQLRMKESTEEEVEEIAYKAKALCDSYDAKLYIDDHTNICKRVGATGVHLGKLDMPPATAREILGPEFIIGGTANTFDDVRRLTLSGVDYIGLGPFRFTTTKKNLSPILGIYGYKQIINKCRTENIDLPILAIGGITFRDIPEIMQTGVTGIALSSTILKATDPLVETKRIIQLINKYHL